MPSFSSCSAARMPCRRGQFDQDAIVADAGFVVQFDQALGLGHAGDGVVRQTRIHFGGDAARNQFEDFQTDVDRQLVGSVGDLLLAIAALAARGAMASSISLRYSGIWAALRISEGLVVASCG